jgi:hypothetical protein
MIVLKPDRYLKEFLVIIFLLFKSAPALDELNWDKPSDSLLTQQFCPIDSLADAMVAQKETQYRIEGNRGEYSVVIFEKKRIKIYSEAGLQYADLTLPYYHYQKIKRIKATCYNYQSEEKKLDKDDIHEEMWVKDKKKDIRLDAKTFAVPGAKAGSVIDISYELGQENLIFLPPYVFHEEIPAGTAVVSVTLADYLYYHYFISNPELIDVKIVKSQWNPVLIATAENIPALEDELLKPPEYNISSRLWLKLNKIDSPKYIVELASSWKSLLKYFQVPQEYRKCLDKSDKVKMLVGELIKDCVGVDSIIVKLFRKVRDDWAVRLYPTVYKPLDNVDKMLEMETLDAEGKATLLCSMLRHAGIESDVVWICSMSDRLKDFPSFFMFDHALTYIPSLDIYLDPCDPGSEAGVIDIAYHDKLALNISSRQNEFLHTPVHNWKNGSTVDITLRLGGSGILEGEGYIAFYYQQAIEARREFRKHDEHDKKVWLNGLLFSDVKDAVKSLSLSPDSILSAEEFRIEFAIRLEGFISADDSYPEIYIYPGISFDQISIDEKPPRQYPVFFGMSNNDFYRVVWEFGENFRPQSWKDIAFKKGISVIGSFAAKYDSSGNSLTVVRQYKNLNAIYKADYSKKIENVREKLKEQDITSVILVRK